MIEDTKTLECNEEFITKEEALEIAYKAGAQELHRGSIVVAMAKDDLSALINLTLSQKLPELVEKAIAERLEVVGKVTDTDGFTGAPFARFTQNPKIGTPLYTLKPQPTGDSK